jgi:hypothetical protein
LEHNRDGGFFESTGDMKYRGRGGWRVKELIEDRE